MIFLSKLSGNSQTKLEHFEEKLEVSFTANWRLKIILNYKKYNIKLEIGLLLPMIVICHEQN